MEYYVFQTESDAQGCIDYINSTPWFPIIGNKDGVPNPDAQTTTCWCETPSEMVSNEWAVPRIPNTRLDYLEVSQSDRDNFMATFGQDIRTLTVSDLVISD